MHPHGTIWQLLLSPALDGSSIISVPQSWLTDLINSYVDAHGKLAVLRTCRAGRDLVLQTLQYTELQVQISQQSDQRTLRRSQVAARALARRPQPLRTTLLLEQGPTPEDSPPNIAGLFLLHAHLLVPAGHHIVDLDLHDFHSYSPDVLSGFLSAASATLPNLYHLSVYHMALPPGLFPTLRDLSISMDTKHPTHTAVCRSLAAYLSQLQNLTVTRSQKRLPSVPWPLIFSSPHPAPAPDAAQAAAPAPAAFPPPTCPSLKQLTIDDDLTPCLVRLLLQHAPVLHDLTVHGVDRPDPTLPQETWLLEQLHVQCDEIFADHLGYMPRHKYHKPLTVCFPTPTAPPAHSWPKLIVITSPQNQAGLRGMVLHCQFANLQRVEVCANSDTDKDPAPLCAALEQLARLRSVAPTAPATATTAAVAAASQPLYCSISGVGSNVKVLSALHSTLVSCPQLRVCLYVHFLDRKLVRRVQAYTPSIRHVHTNSLALGYGEWEEGDTEEGGQVAVVEGERKAAVIDGAEGAVGQERQDSQAGETTGAEPMDLDSADGAGGSNAQLVGRQDCVPRVWPWDDLSVGNIGSAGQLPHLPDPGPGVRRITGLRSVDLAMDAEKIDPEFVSKVLERLSHLEFEWVPDSSLSTVWVHVPEEGLPLEHHAVVLRSYLQLLRGFKLVDSAGRPTLGPMCRVDVFGWELTTQPVMEALKGLPEWKTWIKITPLHWNKVDEDQPAPPGHWKQLATCIPDSYTGWKLGSCTPYNVIVEVIEGVVAVRAGREGGKRLRLALEDSALEDGQEEQLKQLVVERGWDKHVKLSFM